MKIRKQQISAKDGEGSVTLVAEEPRICGTRNLVMSERRGVGVPRKSCRRRLGRRSEKKRLR